MPSTRRNDVQRAYDQLAQLSATADLAGAATPLEQFVRVLRHLMPQFPALGSGVAPGVRFTPVVANGVAAEWVTTESSHSQDRIVYVHGGAWVAGSALDYRPLTAALALHSGASVLAIDYRLAPKHRFPAALEDCSAALAWAFENAPDGRAQSADRLALIGDSAGGNLAAATCLHAVMNGSRRPDRLALMSATLDHVPNEARRPIDDPPEVLGVLAAQLSLYLSEGATALDPRVSPVYASDEHLAAFPPTLLQVSSSETLLYDSRRLAQRLQESGGRVSLSTWPGMPHVWQAFLDRLPEAREAVEELAAFAMPRPHS